MVKIQATAHVRNDDVRRFLNKAECQPGDVMIVPVEIAQAFVERGWAVVVADRSAAVEFGTVEPAERALSRRGRAKRGE